MKYDHGFRKRMKRRAKRLQQFFYMKDGTATPLDRAGRWILPGYERTPNGRMWRGKLCRKRRFA